jgi:hypothetical protein
MAAIDVGSAATTRITVFPKGYTFIDISNPANATGNITSVELYFYGNATGVIVGIFYGSGTSYTCRDYESVGAVTGGSKQTKNVTLTVTTGDFIGLYVPSDSPGQIYLDVSGGSGGYYKTGNQTATGTQTYLGGDSYPISIYGIGATGVSVAPTVTTQPVTEAAAETATGNGTVVSDGGDTITDRGICWKTSTGPLITDSHVHVAGTTGAFTGAITGLSVATKYYVKAFATNGVDITYGTEVSFTTPNLDMGAAAISRAWAWPANYTLIEVSNPCNASGTITKVRMFFSTNATGVKVGTFYGSGTDYTCRASASIGNVSSGAAVEYTVSLAVQSGDFLGIYVASGTIMAATSGGAGNYFKSGDQTAAGQQVYSNSYAETNVLSLYATGLETTISTVWYATGIGDYCYGVLQDGTYLYASLYAESWPGVTEIHYGRIAQIDPATMASTAVTPYKTTRYDSLAVYPCTDGTNIYLPLYQDSSPSVAELAKITMATLAPTAETHLIEGGENVWGHSHYSGGYVYWCTWNTTTNTLRKTNTTTMAHDALYQLGQYYSPQGLWVDGDYLYLLCQVFNTAYTQITQHILKFTHADLALVTDKTCTIPGVSTFTNNRLREIVVLGDYIYALRHTYPATGEKAALYKYAKADLSYIGILQFNYYSAESLITDGTYLYMGVWDTVYRVNPATMEIIGSIIPVAATGVFGGGKLVWGDYIYCGGENIPGVVEKRALTEFGAPPVVVEYPIVNESGVTNIQPTSATVTIAAIADGGHVITELGVCYSTAANPVADATSDQVTTTAALGSYNLTLTGLTPQTTYHTKAYMKLDTPETVYSSIEYDFTTSSNPEPPVDPPPVYPTIAQASAKLNSASRRRFMTTSI